ncbi:hypothetical protein [Bacillus alkalicellulosilyticus]|uniref:hypothetical protein n=1 Tax=Alkalihalobacterium alkalicellulosilyticum TaxID=1912214 RepID=UPI001FE583FF|nr:hypothetical protein [Bacillus alkalicellulosilyticus]
MKSKNVIVVLMTVLPWLTVPFLGRTVFKRYFPATVFMSLYLLAEGRLAEKRKWWWFSYNVKPNVLGELPLIVGPFFIGSLWIMKYSYGKFGLYMLINAIVDGLFTYIGLSGFKKIGYVTLVRLSKHQLSLVFLIKTFVLYGAQVLYEKYFYTHPATQQETNHRMGHNS